MDELIFSDHPSMILATNRFVRVPIVLQYEDTPLIQFVRTENAGYATEIPIYHADGTFLAKVVGSQIYPTEDGKKAGITLLHPDKMTVCKQGERVLFEIRRDEAAALKTHAELYAPGGYFLKCKDTPAPELYDISGDSLKIGGMAFSENTFEGCRIGIWVKRDSLAFGVG